jgi:multidrug efflux pump subunit AcrA (membrane-fusion protein)
VASNGSYYAVITIEKTEGMYEGFSATATIVKEQVTDVITIPLAAVQQQGGELFVYTTASEDGELGSPSVIETGLSNESTVEVLSGLSEGSTVYYQQQITTGAASTTTNIFGGSGSSAGMPSFGGGSSSGRPSAPSGGPSGSFGGGPPSG